MLRPIAPLAPPRMTHACVPCALHQVAVGTAGRSREILEQRVGAANAAAAALQNRLAALEAQHAHRQKNLSTRSPGSRSVAITPAAVEDDEALLLAEPAFLGSQLVAPVSTLLMAPSVEALTRDASLVALTPRYHATSPLDAAETTAETPPATPAAVTCSQASTLPLGLACAVPPASSVPTSLASQPLSTDPRAARQTSQSVCVASASAPTLSYPQGSLPTPARSVRSHVPDSLSCRYSWNAIDHVDAAAHGVGGDASQALLPSPSRSPLSLARQRSGLADVAGAGGRGESTLPSASQAGTPHGSTRYSWGGQQASSEKRGRNGRAARGGGRGGSKGGAAEQHPIAHGPACACLHCRRRRQLLLWRDTMGEATQLADSLRLPPMCRDDQHASAPGVEPPTPSSDAGTPARLTAAAEAPVDSAAGGRPLSLLEQSLIGPASITRK